jgi:hypothetical protein
VQDAGRESNTHPQHAQQLFPQGFPAAPAGQVQVLGMHGQHLHDEPSEGAEQDAAMLLEILPLHSVP